MYDFYAHTVRINRPATNTKPPRSVLSIDKSFKQDDRIVKNFDNKEKGSLTLCSSTMNRKLEKKKKIWSCRWLQDADNMVCLFCRKVQFYFFHSTVWVKTTVTTTCKTITPVLFQNKLTTVYDRFFLQQPCGSSCATADSTNVKWQPRSGRNSARF